MLQGCVTVIPLPLLQEICFQITVSSFLDDSTEGFWLENRINLFGASFSVLIALLGQTWHFDIWHVLYAFLYCMHVAMTVYAKKYKCIAEERM